MCKIIEGERVFDKPEFIPEFSSKDTAFYASIHKIKKSLSHTIIILLTI